MGRSDFYRKTIESSEYLDDHLAWLGIAIGLRSESIKDKWSQTGQDRCGQNPPGSIPLGCSRRM